ncbi:MAG: polyprenyl synthetase family protein [Myxococcota bacterium]
MKRIPTPSEWMADRRARVEEALRASSPAGTDCPDTLREAMSYALLAGGKRLRPILALAGARAVGGAEDDAMAAALAVEHVHTYSLVHDDLPAMDDDDLRRGKPTTHKVYGEGMAVLVGDALLTRAFELLSDPDFVTRVGADRAVRVLSELSTAAGACGMVGGQVVDIESEGRAVERDTLLRLHRLKTGALIRASVVGGALAAGGRGDQVDALRTYGERVGLAFQVVDDVLDVVADTETLGKPQGSDARNEKTTFVTLLGVDGARGRARELVAEAKDALESFGDAAAPLRAVADFIEQRTH